MLKKNKIVPLKTNGRINKDDEMLPITGVSTLFLKQIINVIKLQENNTSFNTTDIVEKYLKSWILDTNLSLIDYMKTKHYEINHPDINIPCNDTYFGDANVFVSHVWSYNFNSLVESLEHFEQSNNLNAIDADQMNFTSHSSQANITTSDVDIENNQQNIYFWIDIFSLNQTNVFSESKYNLKMINQVISYIGNTCSIINSWKEPIYFDRLWCLYEIYATYHTGAKLHLQYEKDSHINLLKLLTDDYESVIKVLNINIDSEYAETTNMNDKAILLDGFFNTDLINHKNHELSFQHINYTISKFIHSWIYQTALRCMYQSWKESLHIQEEEFLQIRNEEITENIVQELSWYEICWVAFGFIRNDRKKIEDSSKINQNQMITRAEKNIDKFVNIANIKFKMSALLTEIGNYTESEDILKDLLQENQSLFGTYHPSSLSIMGNLALLYKIQERYEESEELYMIVLTQKENSLGLAHPSTLTTLQNLGCLVRDAGNHMKAIQIFRRLIADQEEELGFNHLDTMKSMEVLADVYLQCGHESDAFILLKKLLQLKEDKYGKVHINIVDTYETLATLCIHEIFDNDQAAGYFRSALQCRELLYGTKHSTTISTCLRFARLQKERKQYDDCLLLFNRVLDATELTFGKLHKTCFDLIQQIIEVYINALRYNDAFRLYLELYDKYKLYYSETSPLTITILNNIGELYYSVKKYNEAEEYLRKSLYQRKLILSPTDIDLGLSYYRLGNCLIYLNQLDDCKKCFESALDIFDSSSNIDGPNSVNSLTTADNLAKVCKLIGDYQLCESLLLRLKIHSKKILGSNHPTTIEYNRRLAEIEL